MKKFSAAILSLFYLASTFGATIHTHYCMGRVTAWVIIPQKPDPCKSCLINPGQHPKKHSCCKDQFRTFRNGDQKLTASATRLCQPFAPALAFPDHESALSHSMVNLLRATANPPPGYHLPLHILNRVLRD